MSPIQKHASILLETLVSAVEQHHRLPGRGDGLSFATRTANAIDFLEGKLSRTAIEEMVKQEPETYWAWGSDHPRDQRIEIDSEYFTLEGQTTAETSPGDNQFFTLPDKEDRDPSRIEGIY